MLTILIADDETPARNRLRDLLGDIAEVRIVAEAKNGKEAIDLAVQTKPDLMLLDIRMPLMMVLKRRNMRKNWNLNRILFSPPRLMLMRLKRLI